MYTITKQFSFSASHVLEHLPEGHRCARLHGHNYVVELVLEGSELNQSGFVRDYGDLAPFKTFIDEELDHRHLNDIVDSPASAENLARFLYEFAHGLWPEVAAVRVSETPMCASVLTTAGDLVFVGEPRGEFYAFNAHTGELLWKYQTGSGHHSSPTTYSVDGRQYIAVPVGWGSWLEGFAPGMVGVPRGNALFAFALPEE